MYRGEGSTKLVVVDQGVKDKEQLLSKSSDLLGTEQSQKVRYVCVSVWGVAEPGSDFHFIPQHLLKLYW